MYRYAQRIFDQCCYKKGKKQACQKKTPCFTSEICFNLPDVLTDEYAERHQLTAADYERIMRDIDMHSFLLCQLYMRSEFSTSNIATAPMQDKYILYKDREKDAPVCCTGPRNNLHEALSRFKKTHGRNRSIPLNSASLPSTHGDTKQLQKSMQKNTSKIKIGAFSRHTPQNAQHAQHVGHVGHVRHDAESDVQMNHDKTHDEDASDTRIIPHITILPTDKLIAPFDQHKPPLPVHFVTPEFLQQLLSSPSITLWRWKNITVMFRGPYKGAYNGYALVVRVEPRNEYRRYFGEPTSLSMVPEEILVEGKILIEREEKFLLQTRQNHCLLTKMPKDIIAKLLTVYNSS